MHVILVHVHVKPEAIEDFREAIIENARGSLTESGVVRFDVLQQFDDPTRFTLVEVYHQPADQEKHRETPHYLKWKERAAAMMADNRMAVRYTSVFPSDPDWK